MILSLVVVFPSMLNQIREAVAEFHGADFSLYFAFSTFMLIKIWCFYDVRYIHVMSLSHCVCFPLPLFLFSISPLFLFFLFALGSIFIIWSNQLSYLFFSVIVVDYIFFILILIFSAIEGSSYRLFYSLVSHIIDLSTYNVKGSFLSHEGHK